MNSHDALPSKPLTPREEEILSLIGEGLSNREIAVALTLALSTVKWYVRQIYNKLGVENRGEAIALVKHLDLPPVREQKETVGAQSVAPRHNLPVAATPFVGREEELATLDELIADVHTRIITITGPGGTGKTRLALEAAGRELRLDSRFSDGIFFVSLTPLESAEEIVATVAASLDFHFQDSGTRSETQQLLDYIRQKQMLLVMDNFEQVLDGRELLTEISERAAEITVIVTSRERLHMRGEQLFLLGGLETAQTVGSLEESPSAELFLNIARRTTPKFQLLEGDDEHLLRICQLVEGMPLGLELAASWVGLLPLSEIASEIEQSLNLLATEHSDVPQRHRSMKATIDVSWTRLSPDQQRAFQELTIFRGGFTRAAALEIAGATLPLLVTLANKSWLSYDRQNDRYQIHELISQYGASRLSADRVRETEMREKHSAFFCAYLREREVDWYGPRQQDVSMEVRGEIDNIQRAWRWVANKGDVALLAQGLNSLCRFYFWEGRLNDGQNACRLAADGLSNTLLEQQADDAQRLALWSHVLVWESVFVHEVAQKERLLSQSQQLLDQTAQTGQDTRAEQAFLFLAKADATRKKDLDEGEHFANLALQMFQELEDRWGEAEALLTLGVCYLFMGAHSRAKELLQDSLAIRRELDDSQGRVRTANFLGLVSTYQGDFEEAATFHQQSLRLSRQLENRWSEKMCLGQLSYTLAWAGRFSAAREAAEEATRIVRDLGQIPDSWHLNMLTMISTNLGHYAEAQASATKALEVARQEGSSGNISWATEHLGKIAFIGGDPAGAKRYLLRSADAQAEWQHVYQALIWSILGYVVRAQGDSSSARKYLIDALTLGIEHRAISPIMCSLPVAALLAADGEQPERATELYSLARQFGHIRNSRWFEDVACRYLDEVSASLPSGKASKAEAKGREMDVWNTAEELLRELDSLIDEKRRSS